MNFSSLLLINVKFLHSSGIIEEGDVAEAAVAVEEDSEAADVEDAIPELEMS